MKKSPAASSWKNLVVFRPLLLLCLAALQLVRRFIFLRFRGPVRAGRKRKHDTSGKIQKKGCSWSTEEQAKSSAVRGIVGRSRANSEALCTTAPPKISGRVIVYLKRIPSGCAGADRCFRPSPRRQKPPCPVPSPLSVKTTTW